MFMVGFEGVGPATGNAVLIDGAANCAVVGAILSGNEHAGISLMGAGDAVIQSNEIAAYTDSFYPDSLFNRFGIVGDSDCSGILIGGVDSTAGNKIVENVEVGIILGGLGHRIQGNTIGEHGIHGMVLLSLNTTVGGGSEELGNVIYQNDSTGLWAPLGDVKVDENEFAENLIGMKIGGDGSEIIQNTIQESDSVGILLSGATNTEIKSNLIGGLGSRVSFDEGLGTRTSTESNRTGIIVDEFSTNNVIGGVDSLEGNEILVYSKYGIHILGSNNEVLGNLIVGKLPIGSRGLPVDPIGDVGILIGEGSIGANENTIGGSGAGEGNTISDNGEGIVIDFSSDLNTIIGNSIFEQTDNGVEIIGDENELIDNIIQDNGGGGLFI